MGLPAFVAFIAARVRPRGERGANLVEYVLLLVLIAVVVAVVVIAFGQSVSSKYSSALPAFG
jgi:Flp pilus assembly pilin Flp